MPVKASLILALFIRRQTAPACVHTITEPFSATPTDLMPSQLPFRNDQIRSGEESADFILDGLVVEEEGRSESIFLTLSVKRSPRLDNAAIVSPPAVMFEIWFDVASYLVVSVALFKW